MATSTSGAHSNDMCTTASDQWELPTVSIVPDNAEKSAMVWPSSTASDESPSSKALYDLSAVDFSIKLPKTECPSDMPEHGTPSSSANHTSDVTLYDLNRNHETKVQSLRCSLSRGEFACIHIK